MEHFIRQASIRTHTPDLGFLVPTPQPPEMVEVNPRIFDMAADIGRPGMTPPILQVTPLNVLIPFSFNFSSFFYYNQWQQDRESKAASIAACALPTKATMVTEGDVAGYHATTFAAGDYPAIAAWLGAHGYASTPELLAWLKTYMAEKWTITAFQLSKDAGESGSGRITSRAIRLSFHTDKPFYPYSEPSDRQKASSAGPLGRALRVTVLSDQRVAGDLVDKSPWPGKIQFAGSTMPTTDTKEKWTANQWLAFARLDRPTDQISLPQRMTSFLDESNPRPGTADLYFAPDSNTASYRALQTDYKLPIERRFDLSHPLNNLAGLILLILVPGAPLYCGWQMMRGGPEKVEPTNKTSRRKLRWLRTRDILLGNAAIVVGTVACFPFGVGLIVGIASIFETPLEGLVTCVFCIPALIIGLGAAHCGCKLCHGRRLLSRQDTVTPLLTYISRWDKVMMVSSLLTGGLALIGILLLVVANVPA